MSFLSYLNENTLNESIDDKGIFKAVFMSGPPGAGKSSTITRIKDGNIEPRIINVDKYTEFLNINDILSVYDRSKKITKNQLVQNINGVLPLFVDTTGANLERLRSRSRILESVGYDTSLVFVNTSLETALKRAEKRTRKVAPAVVKEHYEKIMKYKIKAKELFSFSMEINNDDGEFTDDLILKAYKKVSYFFTADIQNPIGRERYDLMRENGWKYLDPNIMQLSEIKELISRWFG